MCKIKQYNVMNINLVGLVQLNLSEPKFISICPEKAEMTQLSKFWNQIEPKLCDSVQFNLLTPLCAYFNMIILHID